MNDVITSYLKLPPAVKGLVVPTPEGDYQILINNIYSAAQQREVYLHEMRHILLGHYQQPLRPLAQLEKEADDPRFFKRQVEQAARKGLPRIPLFPAPPNAPPAAAPAPKTPIPPQPPQTPAQPPPYASAAYYHAQLMSIRRATLTGML